MRRRVTGRRLRARASREHRVTMFSRVPLPPGEGAAKRRVRELQAMKSLIRPFGPPSPGGRRRATTQPHFPGGTSLERLLHLVAIREAIHDEYVHSSQLRHRSRLVPGGWRQCAESHDHERADPRRYRPGDRARHGRRARRQDRVGLGDGSGRAAPAARSTPAARP